MLTEYALTPHIFDDEYNADDPDWLAQLRLFGERLLPASQDGVFNTVIANLHAENWLFCGFAPLIDNLQARQDSNRSVRLPALDLLKQLRPRLERQLVRRPICDSNMPLDEAGWVDEAFSSSKSSSIPIHRIVACSSYRRDSETPDQPIALLDTRQETFWNGISATQELPADISEQCNAIRSMCTFYKFIAFASPYLDVQGSTDLGFVVEMVKTAFNRPRGFGSPARIDLHTKGPAVKEDRQSFVYRIREKLIYKLGEQADVIRLYLWPHLLERRLLVGRINGDKPAVVWAVSMTHVARRSLDGPNQEDATFALLPAKGTSRHTSRYYNNSSGKPYPESPVLIRGG